MNGDSQAPHQSGAAPHATLARSLSLTHATLYGLGVTIGAGIYVLIGAAAARAGMHAPVAFVLAAVLMALRLPRSPSWLAAFRSPPARRPMRAKPSNPTEWRPRRTAGGRHRRRIGGGDQRRQRRLSRRIRAAAPRGPGRAPSCWPWASLRLGDQGIGELRRRHDADRGRRPAAAHRSPACIGTRSRHAPAGSGPPLGNRRRWPASGPTLLAVFAFIGFEGWPTWPRRCAIRNATCRVPSS